MVRIGGDEFVSFLADATEEDAIKAAERILGALSRTRIDGVVPAVIIGVACGSPDDELARVLSEADTALYVAKGQGGRSFILAKAPVAAEWAGRGRA